MTPALTVRLSPRGHDIVRLYATGLKTSINQTVLDAAASVVYTKTFMWSIDTIDWKPISQGGPTAQQIVSKVEAGAAGGSTVLMHLGGYETLAALRLMVPVLREHGYSLTSLSDLLDER